MYIVEYFNAYLGILKPCFSLNRVFSECQLMFVA